MPLQRCKRLKKSTFLSLHTLKCNFNLTFFANSFPHSLHTKPFWFLCSTKCSFKMSALSKLRKHILQLNPWLNWWFFKHPNKIKLLSHWSHLYLRLECSKRTCWSRPLFLLNVKLHSSHLIRCSSSAPVVSVVVVPFLRFLVLSFLLLSFGSYLISPSFKQIYSL